MSGIDAEAIAELFAAFGPVHVRRMFGGAGIYSDGVFFAIVDEGVIYLKADDESAPRFAAEGCRQFIYQGKNREIAMSYWRMPERLYDDPDELADWARQACAAAMRSKVKKPGKKKTSARRHSGTRRKARARNP